jgi:hypothetical protein
MNFDLNSGLPNFYDNMNSTLMNGGPIILILLSVLIIFYYVLFEYLGTNISNVSTSTQPVSYTLTATEILFWGILIFLIVINGIQYFFEVDIRTSIRNIFSETPEIDITLIQEQRKEEPIPEIEYVKQVFNIPANDYTYDDAKALCKAYGSRLATYDEIEKTYNEGGEWCSYGWSENQLALFPTQKKTYDKLQNIKGHENDCGRPGINGGLIANPNVRFGVNCFGYKPEMNQEERKLMDNINPYPLTKKEKELEEKVKYFRKKLPDILVSPFNQKKWSLI